MYRGNTQAVREKLGGSGIYMKPKDFEGNAVRIRPILWLCDGMPCDGLSFLEGWHDVQQKDAKGKVEIKSKPIRFKDTDSIPDGIVWSKSSYKGGPMKPQTPKPGFGLVAWNFTDKTVKVITFTHSDPVKYFLNISDRKNEDGSENESYIEDLTKVDFILKKEEDSADWTITNQLPKGGPDLTPDMLKGLSGFKFSWDAWLKGEQIDDDNGISYDEVVDVATSGAGEEPVAKNKNTEKSVASSSNNAKVASQEKSWKDIISPNGTPLGKMSLKDLEGAKAILEGKDLGKPAIKKLYDYVCAGVTELSAATSGEEIAWDADAGDDDIAF